MAQNLITINCSDSKTINLDKAESSLFLKNYGLLKIILKDCNLSYEKYLEQNKGYINIKLPYKCSEINWYLLLLFWDHWHTPYDPDNSPRQKLLKCINIKPFIHIFNISLYLEDTKTPEKLCDIDFKFNIRKWFKLHGRYLHIEEINLILDNYDELGKLDKLDDSQSDRSLYLFYNLHGEDRKFYKFLLNNRYCIMKLLDLDTYEIPTFHSENNVFVKSSRLINIRCNKNIGLLDNLRQDIFYMTPKYYCVNIRGRTINHLYDIDSFLSVKNIKMIKYLIFTYGPCYIMSYTEAILNGSYKVIIKSSFNYINNKNKKISRIYVEGRKTIYQHFKMLILEAVKVNKLEVIDYFNLKWNNTFDLFRIKEPFPIDNLFIINYEPVKWAIENKKDQKFIHDLIYKYKFCANDPLSQPLYC